MMVRARVILLAAAVLMITAPGCGKKNAEDKSKTAAESTTRAAPPTVRFGKVEEKMLAPTLEVSGSLAADESSEVASATTGICTKVSIDVGARVKKGDVLVQLDNRDPALRAQAADASATQALAKLGLKSGEKFDPNKMAEVRAAKEGMDLAVDEAARTKKLLESGSVAQATYDQARTRAEQARAQYDSAYNGAMQAYAGLAAAQSQANLARKNVADTSIRAPFDGAVAERRISAGEFAQMGRVVAVVVRDDVLRLRIDIPETDSSKIAVGKEVTLTERQSAISSFAHRSRSAQFRWFVEAWVFRPRLYRTRRSGEQSQVRPTISDWQFRQCFARIRTRWQSGARTNRDARARDRRAGRNSRQPRSNG
jgi:multidrug efflux pump subunit AcrA (membrane-fusion protein)